MRLGSRGISRAAVRLLAFGLLVSVGAGGAAAQVGVEVDPIEPDDPEAPETQIDAPADELADTVQDAVEDAEAAAEQAVDEAMEQAGAAAEGETVEPAPPGFVRFSRVEVRYLDPARDGEDQRQVGISFLEEQAYEDEIGYALVNLARDAGGAIVLAGTGVEDFEAFAAELADEGELISNEAVAFVAGEIEVYLADTYGWVAKVRMDRGAPDGTLGFIVEVDVGPYPVREFGIVFLHDHPDNPLAESLLGIEVELGLIKGSDGAARGYAEVPGEDDDDLGDLAGGVVAGYAAPRAGLEIVRVRLDQLPADGPKAFYFTGLRVVVNAIRDEVTRRGILGVLVLPHPEQIDPRAMIDYRSWEPLEELDENGDPIEDAGGAPEVPLDPERLDLLVYTGKVSALRSVGFGPRLAGSEDIENNPAHARILERSPIQPGDLLERAPLDRYLYRLNRMPGRRVDAAIGPGEEQTAQLDFLVSERKPWLAYAQISNTGTEATDEIRYRFGLNWTQLRDKEDVLSIDYVTAGFDASHALLLTYESRLWDLDRWRWRVDANWSEFTASDVGFAGENFEGDSYGAGAELIFNLAQRKDWFLDVFAGIRFTHTSVDNTGVGIEAESDFLLPRFGVRMERTARTARSFATVFIEGNLPELAGTSDDDELNGLGRLFVDDDWVALKWDLRQSFFIEPALNFEKWRAMESSLAHELSFVFRGQHALGNRLIPQEQQVAGGLYSVRGYPESAVAGDTVVVGSAEYRLHISRLVEPGKPGELWGRTFRWRPQEKYGDPDWGLVVKAFVDVGQAFNSDRLPFENDDTLLGAGIGVEMSFTRSLSVRVDYGVALRGTDDDEVESGDSEVHFVATFLF